MLSLWLVHNGVPFDVAFSLQERERLAFAIAFSSFEGRKFDWDDMRFRET